MIVIVNLNNGAKLAMETEREPSLGSRLTLKSGPHQGEWRVTNLYYAVSAPDGKWEKVSMQVDCEPAEINV